MSAPDLSAPAPQPDLQPPLPDMSGPAVTQCGNIPVVSAAGKAVNNACLDCITASCCVEGTNCGSDMLCVALRNCQANCQTAKCAQDCNTTYALGQTTSSAFDSCRDTKCNPACNDLSCVGNVVWPDPPQTSYAMRLFAKDYNTSKLISNVLIKVCPPADATCANPTAMGTTDASGSVTLNVPVNRTGIDGFVELSTSTHMPVMYYLNRTDLLSVWSQAGITIFMISKTNFNQLMFAVGATPDAMRGHLGFLARDCSANLLAGVSLTASSTDAQSIAAYLVRGVPSKTATQTDGSGFGFIVNVPPGSATLTSQIGSTRFGSRNVLFRPGAITTTDLMATP